MQSRDTQNFASQWADADCFKIPFIFVVFAIVASNSLSGEAVHYSTACT